MAVTDTHCNTQTKCREEGNPELLLASLEQGTQKIEPESNKQTQVEVCAKPLVDTVIVTQAENVETSTTARNEIPKNNKNELGELQLQKCDSSSILIGVESNLTSEEVSQLGDANGNGGLCVKPLLEAPIPIVPQEEKAEAATRYPNSTPKKKRKKKRKRQTCDTSIPIGVEPSVTKEEGAEQSDANVNKDHEIAVPGIIEGLPVPDSSPPVETSTTACNEIPKNNKNELGELQLQRCDSSSILIGVESSFTNEEGSQLNDVNGNGGLCVKPLLDAPVSIVPQEEQGEAATQNPNPTSKKKRKKKRKRQTCDTSITIGVEPSVTKEEGTQESDANVNKDHGIAVPGIIEGLPVPDSSPPEDVHRKKKRGKKKKSVVTEPKECNGTDNPQQCFLELEPKAEVEKGLETNAEQSQLCPKPELVPLLDIAIPSDLELNKREEPIITNVEDNQACSRPELASPLDLPTPIYPEKKEEVEPSEACAQHPEPQPCSTTSAEHPGDTTTPVDQSKRKRKRKRGRENRMCSEEKAKNQGNPLHIDKTLNQALNQTCDTSIPIGVEPSVTKEEGAQESDANVNKDHGIVIPGIIEGLPVPDSSPPEDVHRKKKRGKKKKSVVTEPKECNGTDNPQQCFLELEPKAEVEKGLETNAEQSQLCPKPELVPLLDIAIPSDLELNKREEPIITNVEDNQACSRPELASPLDLPTPIYPEKKEEVEPSEACAQHPEPQPCSTTSAEHPGDTTTPVDQSKRKRKRKRGRENRMCSEEKAENQGNPLHIDKTLNQALNQTCDTSISIGVEPSVTKEEGAQESDANVNKENEIAVPGIIEGLPVPDSSPLEDVHQKKKRRKKKKSAVTEPKECNGTDNPQQCFLELEPKAEMEKGLETNAEQSQLCPKPELVPLLGVAIPSDLELNKMEEPIITNVEDNQACSRPELASPLDLPTPINPEKKEEVEPSEACAQHPEPQPCSTTSAEHPGDTTTPVDQSKRKRKRKRGRENRMCSEEKAENQGNPLHIDKTLNQALNQVQQDPATICLQPATLTDQTIPVDPAILIDSEKKKRKRKSRSRSRSRKKQKNEGLESEKHNTDLTAETPVQKTEGPTAENSTECWSCRQPGHTFQNCRRLKFLSKNVEVCFFCGEIGHSLGKCCVCHAGGGRFAKCLLCYGRGHFSYNCPRNAHRVDPEVVAANGAINRKQHRHFSYNCPRNGHDIDRGGCSQ